MTKVLEAAWLRLRYSEPPVLLLLGLALLPLAMLAGGGAPPWPAGIAWATSPLNVVVAVWASRRAARAAGEGQPARAATLVAAIVAAALAYLLLASRFTFTIPTTGEIGVKGFLCTPEASLVFPENCPGNELDALGSAEYEGARIWRQWTIDVVRVGLVSTWLAALALASVLLARLGPASFGVLLRRAPPPCAGGEDYYFMSYAHSDLARILPILARLGHDGHQVWYDRGIPGATAWDETLSVRLRGCRAAIVFLSRAALASRWVRREVMFADDLEKPIFCVRLEPCTLPPPLDIALARIQMVEGGPEHVAVEFGRAMRSRSTGS